MGPMCGLVGQSIIDLVGSIFYWESFTIVWDSKEVGKKLDEVLSSLGIILSDGLLT